MPEHESARLMAGVRSKDLSCKNKLGHPRLFLSLSQQWAKATLLDTCDGRDPLHNAQQAAMWNQTVWPLVPRKQQEKDQSSKQDEALITQLWDQLAKVDYFSPLLWRVDVYGNVLYRFADAGTALSWSVDHLFPVARGGLSKMPNMRIIQSHAHINKGDSLEFLLTRDMVCTGLSMLDFKVTVKYSMEDLLTKYGKQASALPVQSTAPKGATLDRQDISKSKSMPRPSHQTGVPSHKDGVPLGLKATRVAHAAAVSSRVFSPSMRSPVSGPVQPSAQPSRHEMDETLGFVQRQGSFHSEHAIQHLMTDHPHTLHSSSHQLHKNTSLPSQQSLRQRDSADSFQRQGVGSKQSFQTDASEPQSQRSPPSAPNGQLSRQSQSQNGMTHRPPLGQRQSIASSALFQTIPVSPRHIDSNSTATTTSDQQGQSHHASHDLPAISSTAAVGPHSYTHGSQDDYSSAVQHERYSNSDVQPEQAQYLAASAQQQPAAMPSAAATPSSAFQSADSFASEMMDTDVNQTQHWGRGMLAQMQQVPEGQDFEEGAGGLHSMPAVHAAHKDLKAEGMLPPTDHAGPGPHDWLWLPDELSTINDSPLSSKEDSRPDIHTWLSQQQAARLAQHAQREGAKFGYSHQWQQAASPTSPLNTADSLYSTFDEHPKAYSTFDERPRAHSSLPWADNNTMSTFSVDATLPSNMSYERVPNLDPEKELQHQPESQPQSQPQPESSVPQQAEFTSPFAHWSSTPILGPVAEPNQAGLSNFGPQHAQQPQQQLLSATPTQQPELLQEVHHSVLSSAAKQQELNARLAALDSLGSMGADDAFEAFGSPVQTRQLSTHHSSSRHTQADSADSELYDTSAPLPVCAPAASLSAPEEALLVTMQEMLDDAAFQQEAKEASFPAHNFAHNFAPKAPASSADDITFPATTAVVPTRASGSSPDRFAPSTPDHPPPHLTPCKVNPMSNFQNLLASQQGDNRDVLSSFHQLLISQELDKQDRLNKFQELLASQKVSKDGKPLTSLAGRVRTMAAQLDILQKRTQELQAASSPSRRVNSPFKARSSPLRGAIGRKSSNSPRTRAASQTSPVSPRTRAFAPSSPDSPHGRAVSNEHGHYEQSLSRRVARISQRFGQHVSGN